MKLDEDDHLIGQEWDYCTERPNSARYRKKPPDAFDNSSPIPSDLDHRQPMKSTEKNPRAWKITKGVRRIYLGRALLDKRLYEADRTWTASRMPASVPSTIDSLAIDSRRSCIGGEGVVYTNTL